MVDSNVHSDMSSLCWTLFRGTFKGACSQVTYFWIQNYQELVNIAAIIEAEHMGLTTKVNSKKKKAYPYVACEGTKNKSMIIGADKEKCIVIGGQRLSTLPVCKEW